MEDRHAQIIALLQQVKSKGMDHDAALQYLETQGFSQEEIEQASYQLLYGGTAIANDDKAYTIVTEMKQLKMQGMSYAQATERLKDRSYTDAEIKQASKLFNYNNPVSYGADDEADAVNGPPPQKQTATPKTGAKGGWLHPFKKLGKKS